MGSATSEKTIIQNIKVAWRRSKAETLDNVLCGMPERMRECIRLHGGYVGK